MRTGVVLSLALLLPACASAAPSSWTTPSSLPGLLPVLEQQGGGGGGGGGGEEPAPETKKEWYPHSPTGKKEFNREGPYIGISAIGSFEKWDVDPGIEIDNSSAGLGVRFGYRSWANLSVELVAEDSMDFEIKTPAGKTQLDVFSVGLQGKYYLATEAFQPYALLGGGWTQYDEQSGGDFDDNGAYVRIGAGFELFVTKDVAIFGEGHLNRTLGGVKDLDHIDIQAGLLFRF